MTRTISASEASRQFDELVRDVADRGQTVVVERGGDPRVVLISEDEFRRMGGQVDEPEDWRVLIERSREAIAKDRGGKPLPDVSEIIHEMREERDAQLLRNFYESRERHSDHVEREDS